MLIDRVCFAMLIACISPFRRESLWPELDKILRDEDDTNTVSTPYTAAILEYRVVVHESAVSTFENQYNTSTNGNASFDIHHPCRYGVLIMVYYVYLDTA